MLNSPLRSSSPAISTRIELVVNAGKLARTGARFVNIDDLLDLSRLGPVFIPRDHPREIIEPQFWRIRQLRSALHNPDAGSLSPFHLHVTIPGTSGLEQCFREMPAMAEWAAKEGHVSCSKRIFVRR